ncbi:MAG TPA: DUF6492 family protein [Polyangiaceae bacterium]|jgi:hypothetical protein
MSANGKAGGAAAGDGEPGLRFAIVTPSYYVDFEACRWLCETVDRYVPKEVTHYLLVDRADQELFAPLVSSPRTRLVFKEDILGGRLKQLSFARRWWVGPKGLPVRGWIVQQLTKLLVTEVADEDVLVFVDSGCFFVRPFNPRVTVQDGRVRLFREQGDYFRNDVVRRWHRIGAKLLGIKPSRNYDVGYVTQLITWRRDNLVRLQDHLQRVSGRSAFDCLVGRLTLSEYYLYGMYSDLILGDRSGHFHTSVMATLCHWDVNSLTREDLQQMRASLQPEHVLVLVNEKSATSLQAVRETFSDG